MRKMLIATIAIAAAGCASGAPETESELSNASESLLPAWWIDSMETTLANGDAADIYYPAIPGARRKLLADAFPVVVHLQGGSVDHAHYGAFARALAQQGFVVIVPNHLRAMAPGAPLAPLTEVQVVGEAVDAIEGLDGDAASPLYRIADTESVALTGHSFGGVVALFAIAGYCSPPFCTPPADLPEIDAAAFYGTHMVQGGMVQVPPTNSVPIALVAGVEDGRALLSQVEQTYDAMSAPRALITLEGLNHYGITDSNPPAGATPEVNEQTLDQELGIKRIARWTGYYLRLQLRGDAFARFWIEDFGGSPDGSVVVITDP